MKTSVSVWCTLRFEGFHRWKDAPVGVGFLSEYHRHVFHVTARVKVTHLNRDIEFITLKEEIQSYASRRWGGNHFEDSCETIAQTILEFFGLDEVTVSEDGENGATVQKVEEHATTDLPLHYPEEEKKEEGLPNVSGVVVRKRPFVGVEAEGPNRGDKTLFIPGSTDAARIANALQSKFVKSYRPSQIYYGAGNDRNINEEGLRLLIDHVKWCEGKEGGLTVEIAGWNHLSSPVRHLLEINSWILVVSLSEVDATRYQVDFYKYVGAGWIVWKGKEESDHYRTSMDDPIFNGDTELTDLND